MSDTPPVIIRLCNLIDSVNAWLGKTLSWLTLFLVIGTTLVVLLRYGFGVGATALQEAVLYAHALIFMGASAWVLQRGGHVRVDVVYQKLSPKKQVLVELFGSLILLLPVCIFLGWASWDYVSNSWATFEGSSESGGLKYVYLQKSIILVLAVGMTLQGLSNLVKAIYMLCGRLPIPEVNHG